MHSCTHEHSLNSFSRNLRLTFANISGTLLTMDFGRRKTRKYSFKDPKIEELMSLIPEIESSTDFRKKYGAIVPLMKLKMKEVFFLHWSSSVIYYIGVLLFLIIN